MAKLRGPADRPLGRGGLRAPSRGNAPASGPAACPGGQECQAAQAKTLFVLGCSSSAVIEPGNGTPAAAGVSCVLSDARGPRPDPNGCGVVRMVEDGCGARPPARLSDGRVGRPPPGIRRLALPTSLPPWWGSGARRGFRDPPTDCPTAAPGGESGRARLPPRAGPALLSPPFRVATTATRKLPERLEGGDGVGRKYDGR